MKELIERAKRGDGEAFIQLMERHRQGLYQVARGYFRESMDIEDVLSETVLACWEQLPTLRRPEFFKTWMTRILINRCNDLWRRRQREVSVEHLPEQSTGMKEDSLFSLLDQLDQDSRLILILYYQQGYKTREIAQMLVMPHGTVTSKLKRGRERLAFWLKEEV